MRYAVFFRVVVDAASADSAVPNARTALGQAQWNQDAYPVVAVLAIEEPRIASVPPLPSSVMGGGT